MAALPRWMVVLRRCQASCTKAVSSQRHRGVQRLEPVLRRLPRAANGLKDRGSKKRTRVAIVFALFSIRGRRPIVHRSAPPHSGAEGVHDCDVNVLVVTEIVGRDDVESGELVWLAPVGDNLLCENRAPFPLEGNVSSLVASGD